jgi:hypothetical protein
MMVEAPPGNFTGGPIRPRIEKSLAAKTKELTAALSRFGIKPGVATGTYVLPDVPCDGSMFGTATKAQLLAAIRKVSSESSPTLESSVSPALLKRLQKACLAEAVKNAREQAEILAGLLDVTLGKVSSASSGQIGISNTVQRAMPITEGPANLPNPAQFQTYIMVSYAFEPKDGK